MQMLLFLEFLLKLLHHHRHLMDKVQLCFLNLLDFLGLKFLTPLEWIRYLFFLHHHLILHYLHYLY
jgi:hypothetical protein